MILFQALGLLLMLFLWWIPPHGFWYDSIDGFFVGMIATTFLATLLSGE